MIFINTAIDQVLPFSTHLLTSNMSSSTHSEFVFVDFEVDYPDYDVATVIEELKEMGEFQVAASLCMTVFGICAIDSGIKTMILTYKISDVKKLLDEKLMTYEFFVDEKSYTKIKDKEFFKSSLRSV